MKRMRCAVGLVAACAALTMLTGCSSSGSCVDDAAPAPLRSRYADADLVAVVRFTSTGRTVQQTAVYPVHEVHVERVLRGSLPRGRLLATVVPGTCSTTGQPVTYEHGDPMSRRGPALLLLEGGRADGVFTVPPWDVVALPPEREPLLPTATPPVR